jgi:hypothetical protein
MVAHSVGSADTITRQNLLLENLTKEEQMFYEYGQNNSGGRFIEPALHVIIEADSTEEADSIAESKGLYFNGCEDGRDCDCCGDRWSPSWSKGDAEPMIYGKPASEYKDDWGFAKADKVPVVAIYYKDGREEVF